MANSGLARALRNGAGLGGLAAAIAFTAPAMAQQASPGGPNCPIANGVATCSGDLSDGVTYFGGQPAIDELRIQNVSGEIAPPGYFAIGYTRTDRDLRLIVADGVVIRTTDSAAIAGSAQPIIMIGGNGNDVFLDSGATVFANGNGQMIGGLETITSGGAGVISLINRGAVSVTTTAQDSVGLSAILQNSTGTVTIQNSGALTAVSGGSGERNGLTAGIRALSGQLGTGIAITNSGNIAITTGPDTFDTDFQGEATGIISNAFAAVSTTTITNSGTLTGTGPNAGGIVGFTQNNDRATASTVTIANSGAIRMDGFANNGILNQLRGLNGTGVTTNTGTVTMANADNSNALVTVIETAIGNATVTNTAAITASGDGYARAIGISGGNPNEIATYTFLIDNAGDITLDTPFAQAITAAATRGDIVTATIRNSGDIDLRGTTDNRSQGLRALLGAGPTSFPAGSSSATIVNSGTIRMGAGNAITTAATTATITNSGALSTTATGAHVIVVNGDPAPQTGQQQAGVQGPAAFTGTTLNLSTTADVIARGNDADAIRIANVDRVTIDVAAGATVRSGGGVLSTGIGVTGDPTLVTLNVAGTVSTDVGNAIVVDGDGALDLNIAATGLVEASGIAGNGANFAILSHAATNIDLAAGATIVGDVQLGDLDDVLTAAAGSSLDGDLFTGAGNDRVTFAGFDVGDIDLGDGDDLIEISGLNRFGDIQAGAGNDTARYTTGAGQQLALDLTGLDIAGFELFVQDGPGQVTFTGSESFASRYELRGGTLIQNATVGDVSLITSAGTTLALGGLVDDLTVGGRLGLGGGAPATRAVNGDIVFQAGSVYDVRILPSGAGDRLDAAGRVTINGGTVNALAGAGSFVGGESYIILTGTGGVTGTFTGLTTDTTAFLDLSLVYEANQVRLVLQQNQVDFDSLARTFNQRSASMPLMDFRTEAGEDSREVYSEFLFLSEAAVPAALDAVSGELHASLLGAGLRMARALPQAMGTRARSEVSDGIGYWVSGLVVDGTIDADGNAAKVRFDRAGVAAGADYGSSSGTIRVGVAGGWSSGDVTVGDRRARADLEAWHLGAYGRVGSFVGGVSARAAVAWSSGDAETERRIAFGGIDRTAFAAYNVDMWSAEAELRYGLPLDGGFAIGPVAGADYARISREAFAESGAESLDLAGADDSDDRWAVGAGGFVGWAGPAGSFDLAILYDHADGAFSETALAYDGAPGGFLVRSPDARDEGVAVRAAADLALGGGWRLGGGYRGRLAGGDTTHAALVTLSLR